MKIFSILIALLLTIALGSCKKDQPANGNKPTPRVALRKVHFELYTNENFSGDDHIIDFGIFMRNSQRDLLDSTIARMKISEIPDSIHRIILDHLVPNNDTSALVVGFTYHIENIGFSWFLDSFPARDTTKIIKYAFR